MKYVLAARSLVCGVFVGISACATNPAAQTAGGAFGVKDPDLITEAEILASEATTVYEVVERTRPRFLTSHIDLATTRERQVYLNGAKLGGIDQLRRIPMSAVREIRFVRSVDGGGGSGGNAGAAIVLIGRAGNR